MYEGAKYKLTFTENLKIRNSNLSLKCPEKIASLHMRNFKRQVTKLELKKKP